MISDATGWERPRRHGSPRFGRWHGKFRYFSTDRCPKYPRHDVAAGGSGGTGQVGLTPVGEYRAPGIPQVLQRFAKDFPKVKLQSSFTRILRAQYARGECDVIVTTGGPLPELGSMTINLYLGNKGHGPAVARLAERIRTAYATIPRACWRRNARRCRLTFAQSAIDHPCPTVTVAGGPICAGGRLFCGKRRLWRLSTPCNRRLLQNATLGGGVYANCNAKWKTRHG